MVQLIIGNKGKGKTKHLLEKVNNEVKTASGNVVYLDKNAKHMFELNNKIRLINVSDFNFNNCDQFLGFICGIISQDHDLQQMYFDSFLNIACLEGADYTHALQQLVKYSEQFGVDFIVSMTVDEKDLAEEFKSNVIISL